jgi:hypothetical protein
MDIKNSGPTLPTMDSTKLLSNVGSTTFMATIINTEEEIKGDTTIRPFTTSLPSLLDDVPRSNNSLEEE